ncbi:hypothetical protein ACVWW4_009298 [Bradyrhizobium sp. LB7.1]
MTVNNGRAVVGSTSNSSTSAVAASTYLRVGLSRARAGLVVKRDLCGLDQLAHPRRMLVARRQRRARQRAQHEQLAFEAEQTVVESGEDGVEIGHGARSLRKIHPALAAIGERSPNGIGAIGPISPQASVRAR